MCATLQFLIMMLIYVSMSLNSVFYSCWMSVKEGTIFAFVVPALVIILVMKYKQNQTKFVGTAIGAHSISYSECCPRSIILALIGHKATCTVMYYMYWCHWVCSKSLHYHIHRRMHCCYRNTSCNSIKFMVYTFQINVVFLCFTVRSLWKSKQLHWSTQEMKKKTKVITLAKWEPVAAVGIYICIYLNLG